MALDAPVTAVTVAFFPQDTSMATFGGLATSSRSVAGVVGSGSVTETLLSCVWKALLVSVTRTLERPPTAMLPGVNVLAMVTGTVFASVTVLLAATLVMP